MKFKLIKLILLFGLISQLQAYVITRPKGEDLKWSGSTSNLSIYVSQGSSVNVNMNSSVFSIAQDARDQWNPQSNVNIGLIGSSSVNDQNGVNDLYFSSNQSLFGGGVGGVVLAVTIVKYSNDIIQEADIVVNDSQTFSTVPMGNNYLGDVITHEMGHFLGLAHSQTHRATMYYSVFNGQHILHDDDKAAVHFLYGGGTQSYGSIGGRIVGGSNSSKVGIFGVQIEAISNKNGKVVASALTEPDGSYRIHGLPLNDNYFLYISPVNVYGAIEPYYSTARSDFCGVGINPNYVGSFYEQCTSSNNQGHPRGVKLTTGSQNVSLGDITIRCALNAEVSSSSTIDNSNTAITSGETIVGFFDSSISNTTNDYTIDLSNINIPTNVRMKIKLISQSLYSLAKANIQVNNGTVKYSHINSSTPSFESRGSLNLYTYENEYFIGLNSGYSGSNYFNIEIHKDSLIDYVNGLPSGVDISDLFFPGLRFESNNNYRPSPIHPNDFYLLILTLERNTNGTYEPYGMKEYLGANPNNNSCIEANKSVSVAPWIESGGETTTAVVKRQSSGGCGMVYDVNSDSGPKGPGNTPFALILGFFMTTWILRMKTSFSRKNIL